MVKLTLAHIFILHTYLLHKYGFLLCIGYLVLSLDSSIFCFGLPLVMQQIIHEGSGINEASVPIRYFGILNTLWTEFATVRTLDM